MIKCICTLSQQAQERRRQDPTISGTGYVPPHAQQRQSVPTAEEEVDKEILRQDEVEDETDLEIV